MNYIIGCGGVGSWLAPSLCLLVGKRNVTLVDGDRLESKNMNRQLFTKGDIGKKKSEALADRYGCLCIREYYSAGTMDLNANDVLICCADNHPARRAAIQDCDTFDCRAIIACNETHSAEAMFYHTGWRGSQKDPRVYYPEIETDHSGDPMARAIGCTGQAQEENRQLVSANFMAAALAQHLYVLWIMESNKLTLDYQERLPFRLRANLSKLESIKLIPEAQPA